MYEIDRDRFKELKHFCRQYQKWKRELELHPLEERLDIENALLLIERTASSCGSYGPFVMAYVTRDISYGRLGLSCDRTIFEYYVRKFYWLLDKRKGV